MLTTCDKAKIEWYLSQDPPLGKAWTSYLLLILSSLSIVNYVTPVFINANPVLLYIYMQGYW